MKTKQQKQNEALERKRKFFYVYIENWIKARPGSEETKKIVSEHGTDFLDKWQKRTEAELVRAAAEAKVDRYGNPF